MKEIIIGCLLALLFLLVGEAIQSKMKTTEIKPASVSREAAPREPASWPLPARAIADQTYSVAVREEPTQQYYAIITEEIIEEEVSP